MPPESSPSDVTIEVEVAWGAVLEEVLATGIGVRSVFQPIIDMRRRTPVGFEALSRFDHPDVPASFGTDAWFNAAHELGFGTRLESAALKSALARRPDLPPNCFMSLNLEPEGLASPEVRAILADQGHLGGLVVEITEHRRLDFAAMASPLQWLRSQGALLAVDDAGAGYAGLAHILELRPSIIKLDRSLIEGIDSNEAKVALVEMVGAFSNRVDAWVLAEGVETVAEARRIADLGIPLGQGYVFAKPHSDWPVIDPSVVRLLAATADERPDTLHRLVEPVAALLQGEGDRLRSLPTANTWTPVLDHNRRPVGVLTSESAMVGELLPSLIANVSSTPTEIAHRLACAAALPGYPVIVVDNAGRYLGLVTIRRLLSHLATNA